MRLNQRGFSLMELLVVVAILGLLLAIAIPNMLDALDRSRQRATVGEIRAWGNALGSYYSERNVHPNGPSGGPIQNVWNQLVPFAASALNTKDKFGCDFYYDSISPFEAYTIGSPGKGCTRGLGVTPSSWTNYSLDIIMENGVFTNAPS
jgi:prepilin-type N-terminal cleavage/methylation domain-containing protein